MQNFCRRRHLFGNWFLGKEIQDYVQSLIPVCQGLQLQLRNGNTIGRTRAFSLCTQVEAEVDQLQDRREVGAGTASRH